MPTPPILYAEEIQHYQATDFVTAGPLLSSLAAGQHPKALTILCIDSRLELPTVAGMKAGDSFIYRNTGALIPPYPKDNNKEALALASSTAAAVTFAIESGISRIIVSGHLGCGAMKGVLNPESTESMPSVHQWLTIARPVLEQFNETHPEQANKPNCPETLACFTHQNILAQVENLKAYPGVAEKIALNELTIHAWYYKFNEGKVLIHVLATDTFLSIDEITQLLNERRHTIIEAEAMNYLAKLTSPKTAEDYRQTIQLISSVKVKGIQAIGEQIKAEVINKLWDEFPDLWRCKRTDEQFTSYIQRGMEGVPLNKVHQLMLSLKESSGYKEWHREQKNIGLFARASQPQAIDPNPTCSIMSKL